MTHYLTLRTLIDITDTGYPHDPSTKDYHNIVNALNLHFRPIPGKEPPGRLPAAKSPFADAALPVFGFAFHTEDDIFAVEIAVRALNNMPVSDPGFACIVTAPGSDCNLAISQRHGSAPFL